MAKGKHGLMTDSKPLSLKEQNQPPARDNVTQKGGPISGHGTRPNDPKS